MEINKNQYGKVRSEMAAMATSINEIVNKFKKLQRPLTESKETVPKATKQLDKISEQTEAATHQMLDRVERISLREEEVKKGLQTIKEKVLGGNLDGVQKLLDELIEHTEHTYNDVFTIMDALQFQDITAQQINHAAAMLEEIETRLHKIITIYKGLDGNEPESSDIKNQSKRAYDPHADYIDRKATQADIDSMFANKTDS